MRKIRLLILKGLLTSIVLLFMQTGFSQTLKTVTGTVTDSAGVAIPNVSVHVEGKTTGVVTNVEGSYSIRAAEGDVLRFSSVGCKSSAKSVLI